MANLNFAREGGGEEGVELAKTKKRQKIIADIIIYLQWYLKSHCYKTAVSKPKSKNQNHLNSLSRENPVVEINRKQAEMLSLDSLWYFPPRGPTPVYQVPGQHGSDP